MGDAREAAVGFWLLAATAAALVVAVAASAGRGDPVRWRTLAAGAAGGALVEAARWVRARRRSRPGAPPC